jgi:hypothetical protein
VRTETDNDGDGYTADVDCDDNDLTVNPGATEICNGIDDDCDGLIDEVYTYYQDTDVDNYGNPNVSIQACTAPSGYVSDNTDCDDSDANINPGATEGCDGVDNDCNDEIDEGFDVDVDGYKTCTGDCNDNNPTVNPGASEISCNGKDDDCNPATPDIITLDLYISAVTAPGSAATGQTISVSDTTNKSGCAAGATTTKIYLSIDNKYSSGDTELGSRAVPAFGAGAQSSSGTTNVTIPVSTPSGSYYIIVRADADGVIAETNEGNNNRVTPITITGP